ncbi:MAG TPA: ABC transporter ATP-binding protein [Gemmatimonadota bacterium]|nr:ABC transporter ATP-binding protein [Gemmatimonadota bacterium]
MEGPLTGAGPDASHARPEDVALAVRGVLKSYSSQQVLCGVDLEVSSGELVVVLGPSGSGKTTLLRIVAGLETPDAGEIWIGGRRADGIRPQERRLGVVFQEQALFSGMSVERNIAFGLEVRRAPPGRVRERLERLLALTAMEPHRHKLPGQLSGGQRQRVALARALAYEPPILLLDEPFNALDAATRVTLRRDVREIQARSGTSALFITHDQEEALELADRIVVLNGGRVEQAGTAFELYHRPRNEFVARFLGAANVLLGRWTGEVVEIGRLRLEPPSTLPVLHTGQAVKVVFRPEDVAVAFAPHLLHVPIELGPAIVDRVLFVGPSERLVVRLRLLARAEGGGTGGIDIGGLPVLASRTKWEASDMALDPGDAVVLGLKDYRLLAHFPLASEGGAKII